jgi:membrane protein implicated in regulation of membrane protease activity
MAWWMWALFGFALLFAELKTPGGFFFVFFGSSALFLSVIDGIGFGGPFWFQWLLFSVLSVTSAALFRPKLIQRFGSRIIPSDVDELSGQDALADEDIGAKAIGKVQMRGTTWSARNLGPGAVLKGQRCRVERVVGIALEVRPLDAAGESQESLSK